MRLLVFAGAEVGAATLAWLLEHYPSDLATVVVEDGDPAADLALAHGLAPVPWGGSAATAMTLAEHGPFDLGLLAWWPHIIRTPLLSLPREGFVNFHPSLLPFNRGKHYNFWALVEQSPFGVTLHRVDEGVDTGEILFQRRIAYDWTDTGGTLYSKAQEGMLELFRESYPSLRAGGCCGIRQEPSAGSFHRASELDPASRLDLESRTSVRELLNRLRARTFPGKPACWFEDGDRTWEVRIQITEKT